MARAHAEGREEEQVERDVEEELGAAEEQRHVGPVERAGRGGDGDLDGRGEATEGGDADVADGGAAGGGRRDEGGGEAGRGGEDGEGEEEAEEGLDEDEGVGEGEALGEGEGGVVAWVGRALECFFREVGKLYR